MPARASTGLTYSEFMHGMKLAGIGLDRKVLADLAAREPASFRQLCDQARSAMAKCRVTLLRVTRTNLH